MTTDRSAKSLIFCCCLQMLACVWKPLKQNFWQSLFPCSGDGPAPYGLTAPYVKWRSKGLILTRSSDPVVHSIRPQSSGGLFATSSHPEQVYGGDNIRNRPPHKTSEWGGRSHRDESCARRIRGLGKYSPALRSPRQKRGVNPCSVGTAPLHGNKKKLLRVLL